MFITLFTQNFLIFSNRTEILADIWNLIFGIWRLTYDTWKDDKFQYKNQIFLFVINLFTSVNLRLTTLETLKIPLTNFNCWQTQRYVHVMRSRLATQRQHHGLWQNRSRSYRLGFAVGSRAARFLIARYLLYDIHDMRFYQVSRRIQWLTGRCS